MVINGLSETLLEARPESITDQSWLKMQQKAKAMIILMLTIPVRRALPDRMKSETTVAAMLKLLSAKYESRSMLRQVFLKRKLEACRYAEGENMHTYLTEIATNIAELSRIGVSVSVDEHYQRILLGLPPSYDAVVATLEGSTERKISDLEARLLLEEQKRKDSASQVLTVSTRTKTMSTRKKVFCEHCKKIGHKMDRCWVLHQNKRKKVQNRVLW